MWTNMLAWQGPGKPYAYEFDSRRCESLTYVPHPYSKVNFHQMNPIDLYYLRFQILFFFSDKCNCDSKTGLYVATTILSILLAVAVGVIFLQNNPKTKTKMRWGRQSSKTYDNNLPQNYSYFTALEEMHQYSTMDSTKQDSPYQNTLALKQSQIWDTYNLLSVFVS